MSNAVFPTLAGLMWDIVKSPRWNTKVQESVGGKETRAQFFSTPIYRWQLRYEILRASALMELQTLIGFFNARQGKFDSFLYSDPSDNAVTSHGFGVGDGVTTAFQLQRTLAGPRALDFSGPFPTYTVPRTNFAWYSEDITQGAYWSTNTGSSLAANKAAAPNGTITASRVRYDGSGVAGAFRAVAQILQPSIFGVLYTTSYWIRADAPITLLLTDNFSTTVVAVTAAWQRIALTSLGDGASNLQFRLGSGSGGNGTFQVYVFGVQAEDSPVATAYIPTTSAAAGATDYTLSPTGLVTLATAPLSASGNASPAALTWTGGYYWRVRFDLDQADFQNFLYQLWEAKSITLVSVKA